jgi:hypothetical protein
VPGNFTKIEVADPHLFAQSVWESLPPSEKKLRTGGEFNSPQWAPLDERHFRIGPEHYRTESYWPTLALCAYLGQSTATPTRGQRQSSTLSATFWICFDGKCDRPDRPRLCREGEEGAARWLEAAEADLALEVGFVHVKARQAFPEIGRQARRREQTAFRRRRSCRALPDAPAPPKLRDRVRGWDLEFESGLLRRRVRCEPDFLDHCTRKPSPVVVTSRPRDPSGRRGCERHVTTIGLRNLTGVVDRKDTVTLWATTSTCGRRAGIADLRALRPGSPVGQSRQRAVDLPRLQHQSRRRAGRRVQLSARGSGSSRNGRSRSGTGCGGASATLLGMPTTAPISSGSRRRATAISKQSVCEAAGLVDSTGKPTITMH